MTEPTANPEPGDLLRVAHSSDADTTWLVLHGALDLSTLPVAEQRLRDAEHERDVLGLDLSELDYIDSSGVRLVLLADQRAEDDGRRLTVRLGNGAARYVFDMLEISQHLCLVDVPPAPRAPR